MDSGGKGLRYRAHDVSCARENPAWCATDEVGRQRRVQQRKRLAHEDPPAGLLFSRPGGRREVREDAPHIGNNTRPPEIGGIYVEFAVNLLSGSGREEAYERTRESVEGYYGHGPFTKELSYFSRILEGNISTCEECEIRSSGYVVDTLESSLFCFLRSDPYSSAVLRAVNLGGDADTTGSVAGGLAGTFYGFHAIPERWVKGVARKEDILHLAEKFHTCVTR